MSSLRAQFALFSRDLRVSVAEGRAALAGKLEGVDLTDVGRRDFSEPQTALERLRGTPGVVVSRDYRDAGRGGRWDRVREYNPAIHGWPKNKERGQARGVLPWAQVSTIVLHTAGVEGMGPGRWLGVPCHAAVASDASIVLCHELNSYLWAAHAANRYSCSIEIAGKRTITDEQISAARALLRYTVEELRARRPLGPDGDMLPLHVAPHRFSHRSRGKDCDVAIWESIGVWGMRELGLDLGPVVGSGRPLPF